MFQLQSWPTPEIFVLTKSTPPPDPNIMIISSTTIGDFIFYQADTVSTISFPNLTSITDELDIEGLSSLITLSMPKMANFTNSWTVNDCPLLSTIDVSGMTSTTGELDVQQCPALQSFAFAAGCQIGGDLGILNNPGLITIQMPTANLADGHLYLFNDNALSVASVNGILRVAATSTPALVGSTFKLMGGTNAAPTGQGLIDKAALIAAGNIVQTN